MRFKNREQAARQLADRLAAHRGDEALVVAIPPDSVPMARLVADALDADFDVLLLGALHASSDPSIATGAIDETGTVFKGRYYEDAGVADLRDQVRAQVDAIRTQRTIYTHLHSPVSPAGRTVIIIDDGNSGAMTLLAAIRSLRLRHAHYLVVAMAVAQRSTLEACRREADDVVVLHAVAEVPGVGGFFEDFGPPTEDQLKAALQCRRRWSKVA